MWTPHLHPREVPGGAVECRLAVGQPRGRRCQPVLEHGLVGREDRQLRSQAAHLHLTGGGGGGGRDQERRRGGRGLGGGGGKLGGGGREYRAEGMDPNPPNPNCSHSSRIPAQYAEWGPPSPPHFHTPPVHSLQLRSCPAPPAPPPAVAPASPPPAADATAPRRQTPVRPGHAPAHPEPPATHT